VSKLLKLRKIGRRPWIVRFQIEICDTDGSVRSWVSSHPVADLEDIIGVGDAWAIVKAASSAKSDEDGGWITWDIGRTPGE